MKKCWSCGEKKYDCQRVLATVGGSYNRAPSSRKVNVCRECAERTVKTATPGAYTNARIDIRSAAYVFDIKVKS